MKELIEKIWTADFFQLRLSFALVFMVIVLGFFAFVVPTSLMFVWRIFFGIVIVGFLFWLSTAQLRNERKVIHIEMGYSLERPNIFFHVLELDSWYTFKKEEDYRNYEAQTVMRDLHYLYQGCTLPEYLQEMDAEYLDEIQDCKDFHLFACWNKVELKVLKKELSNDLQDWIELT